MSKPYAAEAAALASATTDQTTSELLFAASAGNDSWASVSGIAPTLSPQVAAQFYRGPLPQAAAIAADPNTDPAVLAQFAADPRVTIRNHLLGNPALPHAQRVKLLVWSLVRKSRDRITDEPFTLLPADRIVEVFTLVDDVDGQVPLHSHNVRRHVAAKLLADPDAFARTPVHVCPTLLTTVVEEHLSGRSHPQLTLTGVLDTDPERAGWVLYRQLRSKLDHLSVEVAAAWRTYADDVGTGPHLRDVPFATVEDGALELLADGWRNQLHAALISGLDEATLRQQLTDAPDPSPATPKTAPDVTDVIGAAFDATPFRSYAPATQQQLLERFAALLEAGTGGSLAQAAARNKLFDQLTVTLPQTMLLQLLRRGNLALTRTWLALPADAVNRPQLETLTALVDDPQQACQQRTRFGSDLSCRQCRAREPHWDHVSFSELADAVNGDPAIAELVRQLHDGPAPKRLSNAAHAQVAAPLLEQAFGNDGEAWETFLTLLPDWSGSFDELVDAVVVLLGRDPRPQPALHNDTGARPAGQATQLLLS